MQQALISAVVAALVCAVAFVVAERIDDGEDADRSAAGAGGGLNLRYTVEPAEDSWVNGARGAGADDRMLSDAADSICFLTKIEVSGFQGPEDTGTCRVAVDDFTGFWKVTADVPDGSRSEIRCNARCLTWK
jgi:hypothetical protein